jgi:hypothetical protein
MDQYPNKPQPRDPEFEEELLEGQWRFVTHAEMEEFLAFGGTRKERKAIKARRKEREQALRKQQSTGEAK